MSSMKFTVDNSRCKQITQQLMTSTVVRRLSCYKVLKTSQMLHLTTPCTEHTVNIRHGSW